MRLFFGAPGRGVDRVDGARRRAWARTAQRRKWSTRTTAWAATAALTAGAIAGVATAGNSHQAATGLTRGTYTATSLPVKAPHPPGVKQLPAGKAKIVPAGPAPWKVPAKPATAAAAPLSAAAQAEAKVRTAQATAIAQAKATGKAVPVPLLTTGRSTTAANPDGTLTATVSLAPMRAWVNGAWVPIDTTLAKAPDGSIRPKAAAADISLSPGGVGPLATVDLNGQKVAITWPLGPLPVPEVAGSSAVYRQVLPSVDLRVTAGPEGVREVLVLADAQAAANPALRTLRFGVTATGLTVKTDASGAMIAVDAHGNTVFGGGTPAMWDSSGTADPDLQAAAATAAADPADGPRRGAKTAAMPVTLSGGTAAVSPDQKLLTDTGTMYPVYVDPTIAAATLYCREIYAGAPTLSNDCGNPTNSGATNIMRAGYDRNADSIGAVRDLFSFDVVNSLRNTNPYSNIPGYYAYDDPASVTSNLVRAVLSLTVNNAPSCNGNSFDLYAAGPITGSAGAGGRPNWQYDGPGTTGALGTTAKLLGTRSASACGLGGKITIEDTTQVDTVFKNSYSGGAGTATLGVRMDQDMVTANNYWSFFFTRAGDPSSSAHLDITYRANPYIIEGSLATSPKMSNTTTACRDEVNFGSLPAPPSTVGYIGKNLGNQVALSAQVGDIEGSESVSAQYQFTDVSSGNVTTTPANSGGKNLPSTGYYNLTTGALDSSGNPIPVGVTSDAITQNDQNVPLKDGHMYRFGAYVYDPLNGAFAENEPTCYFIVAFNAPDAPTVHSDDFLPLGTPAATNMYATMPSTTGFRIHGTTAGVNVDHFEYVIDDDSSKIPSIAAGSCTTATGSTNSNNGCAIPAITGTNPNNNAADATIQVPTGITTLGDNTLWVRAVDKAGNISPATQYDFYLPGNPKAVPTLGDITGDGIPDVLTTAPDPTSAGNLRLVTFPGNTDPAITSSSIDAAEAAPASDAPDGVSWANTLTTHRGALRGIAVDDLFAYSTTTHSLYYYLNSNIFGGVAKTDQYAINHKILIQRPACVPSPLSGNCAGYAPDWSQVTQILALGSATGGPPGTFAGRTDLITVESDGDHKAHVWLFSPGPGVGQLANPVLLSFDVGQFNWADGDLIAPGATTGSSLPDLWVRDRASGSIYQFINQVVNGTEDPTSLGNQTNATVIGSQGAGQYGASAYQSLVAAGTPNVASGTGVLTQDGQYPGLWSIGPRGKLDFLPGSPTGPVTTTIGDWGASTDAWSSANGVSTINGAPIAQSSGPLRLGEGQTAGNIPLCIELTGGNTAERTSVQGQRCNGGLSQAWTFSDDGTIRYTGDTTKCLQVSVTAEANVQTPWGTAPGNYGAPAGTMNGTPVEIGACGTAGVLANQRWIVQTSANGSSGYYGLYNPAAARCLDNGNDLATAGQQLWILDCNDTEAQQFGVMPAPGAPLSAIGGGLGRNTGETATAPTAFNVNSNYSYGQSYTLSATKVGDNYGVDWYVPYDGDYLVEPHLTNGPGNGIVQMSVDGTPLPATFDGYSTSIGDSAPALGAIHLTAGWNVFTFTVAGQNPSSTGYKIGLTGLDLMPNHGTAPTVSLAASPATTAAAPTPAPLPVTLDAGQTFAGQNAIANYTFDFGDGTVLPAQTSPVATHTYTAAGTYTATLTATDTGGLSATTTTVVYIAAPTPPTAALSVPSAAPR